MSHKVLNQVICCESAIHMLEFKKELLFSACQHPELTSLVAWGEVAEIYNQITLEDYFKFINMDEVSVKKAFVVWLTELCSKHGWLDENGEVVATRLAEYFGKSRQAISNCLTMVAYPSSDMINTTIAPRVGITSARFWHEIQMIDNRAKGIVILTEAEKQAYLDTNVRIPQDAAAMAEAIKQLSQFEQRKLQKFFLKELLSKVD